MNIVENCYEINCNKIEVRKNQWVWWKKIGYLVFRHRTDPDVDGDRMSTRWTEARGIQFRCDVDASRIQNPGGRQVQQKDRGYREKTSENEGPRSRGWAFDPLSSLQESTQRNGNHLRQVQKYHTLLYRDRKFHKRFFSFLFTIISVFSIFWWLFFPGTSHCRRRFHNLPGMRFSGNQEWISSVSFEKKR